MQRPFLEAFFFAPNFSLKRHGPYYWRHLISALVAVTTIHWVVRAVTYFLLVYIVPYTGEAGVWWPLVFFARLLLIFLPYVAVYFFMQWLCNRLKFRKQHVWKCAIGAAVLCAGQFVLVAYICNWVPLPPVVVVLLAVFGLWMFNRYFSEGPA